MSSAPVGPRADSIGFISTLCTGPHDRHAFEQPEYYVTGHFNPPTIRLDNAHRSQHLRSFIWKIWNAVSADDGKFLDKYIDPEMLMKSR